MLTIPVSGPVLKKQWRGTHFLDVCLVVLVNDFYLESNSLSGFVTVFSHFCQQF